MTLNTHYVIIIEDELQLQAGVSYGKVCKRTGSNYIPLRNDNKKTDYLFLIGNNKALRRQLAPQGFNFLSPVTPLLATF